MCFFCKFCSYINQLIRCLVGSDFWARTMYNNNYYSSCVLLVSTWLINSHVPNIYFSSVRITERRLSPIMMYLRFFFKFRTRHCHARAFRPPRDRKLKITVKKPFPKFPIRLTSRRVIASDSQTHHRRVFVSDVVRYFELRNVSARRRFETVRGRGRFIIGLACLKLNWKRVARAQTTRCDLIVIISHCVATAVCFLAGTDRVP